MQHSASSDPSLQVMCGSPTDCFRQWQQTGPSSPSLLLVNFEFEQYWLEPAEPLALTAIYHQRQGKLQVAVTDRAVPPADEYSDDLFDRWIESLDLAVFNPKAPLLLEPCQIPKPWGQEIWYTGVEERGVCHFGGTGKSAPIPWVQAVLPDAAAGAAGQPLILLKILDPVPDAVTGDLYFELHEEKHEVYVVTSVDREAWPDGTGYIRYGFSPEKLRAAGSGQALRQSYLEAVQAYEAVRRELDALPEQSIASDAQLGLEQRLREEMESFTHMRPLEVGDVVVVPLLLPHSLQHGVRTVEFQTPVYERQILSFAQKVLTQDHWDTSAAVEQMRLMPPEEREFDRLLDKDGVRVERIVDFPDFEVRRIRVETGAALAVPELEYYALVMVIEGELAVGSACLCPEQALLLPRAWSGFLAPDKDSQNLVLLLALPRS